MAVLNATAPMWGALLTVLLLGERLTARRAAGLALGVIGVAVLFLGEALSMTMLGGGVLVVLGTVLVLRN
jgi:drug/metabolite transporter (DMT)-like permease